EDECLTSRRLLEFMCNNDERIEMVRRTCTSSERCEEGACVSRTGGNNNNNNGGTGACINGQESCDGTILEICTSGVWRDVGKQDGKCNYNARSEDPDEFTCSRDSQCDEDEVCNNGSCQLEPGSSAGLWVAIITITVLIIIIVGAIIFVTIKNKNKTQNRRPSNVTMTPKRPPTSGTTNQRRQPPRT
ncbi:hypothetical protein CMI46_00005, partial [Candidatus Pacearchaeota archaeon]|nr:hypothetical protein [Candidatus Pacearchaeota archaeon]